MKKLISVFAALALVGSLAAQKKKAAPKAPAKPAAPAAPVVAAPAAPVVAAPAMPAAAGSSAAGMGLFVDLRGTYTFANGTSTAQADGSAQTDTTTTAVTYKTSASQAIGGGLSVGYDIAPGLAVAGSFDFRSFKTREYKQGSANLGGAGAGSDVAIQQKWTNMVIGLGLRPHVNALGGEFYGGGGLAIVLPYETTQTQTYSNSNATWNTNTGSRTKTEEVKGYNLALGAYAEVGYKYFFTENIGLVVGLRAIVATTDNIGKTKVVTNTGAATTTATTTYKDSYSSQDNTTEQAAGTASASRSLAAFETLGITDFSGNVGVALRF